MANTIKLTGNEWKTIHQRLKAEYPLSYTLIRSVMRRELGFTVREHKAYMEAPITPGDDLNFGYTEHQIHLDFYDDALETMFRLKYL